MNIRIGEWTWLEIAKLTVGIITPISIAILGWVLARRQWFNQKLVEKRIELYDQVAPQLNNLLCFYTWVGHWKRITPDEILETKRELDKLMNVYRYIFNEDVYDSYRAYMNLLFLTFQAPGSDAKIKSLIRGQDGNRLQHGLYEWQDNWNDRFSDPDDVASHTEIKEGYSKIMNFLRLSIGVQLNA